MSAKAKKSEQGNPYYRLLVTARIAAAVLGGYAFATATILLLTYLLPMPQQDALMLSTMLGYLIFAIAIIWVFSVKTVKRAWLGIIISTSVVSALVFLLHTLQQSGS